MSDERMAYWRGVIAGLPASVRVYLCANPCDMRKSFDGLHRLVRKTMELDAFAGHLYVFGNKRKDRIRIIYWDRDGFCAAVFTKSWSGMCWVEGGRYRRYGGEGSGSGAQANAE